MATKRTEATYAARKWPNGWVYEIEGDYGPDDAVPPEAVVGAWNVDPEGRIVGDFIPDPNYRSRQEGT